MSAHGKMRPAQARRRGQALLIAVLLMVFAAVLGATFVTVVALNLNQTARSGSVNTARVAAIAGSNYVNDQLTNSPLGENWRPQLDASQPSASGDTYYYTDFERAQGWDQPDAQTETVRGTVTKPQFVKFPDPRSTAITGNNTPTFLTKVEKVDAAVDPGRAGQLKVTVLGRASDNDAATSTLVFYKPTSQNGNMTSFARYDSNWNFGTNNLVKTTTSAASPSDNVIVVKSSSGFIPGRTILIGAADNPASVRIAIISSIPPNPDGSRGNQIYVTPIDNQPTPAPISIPANTFLPVRAVSPYVGGLPNIDAQGTESVLPASRQATETPSEYQDVLVTPPPLTAPTVSGGIMINNGVLFEGKSQFALNTTTSIPDRVLVAGLISINGGAIANVKNNAATEDIKTTSVLTPYVRYQQSESTDPTDRTQVVRSLTPARLDSPNSRWLQLTKLTGNAGAFYGYGGGVYLNNREDIEQVARLVDFSQPDVNKFLPRALTIAEMQRLWTRKSFLQKTADEYGNVNNGGMAGPLTQDASVPAPTPSKNKYQRLTWPRPGVTGDSYMYPMNPLDDPVDPTKHFTPSLEQQALRGWISPMQFLPRGALIELKGNKIVITRDDLSDQLDKVITSSVSGPNPDYHKPDAAKAWKTTNGGAVASGAKTYRMVIDTTTGARSFGALDNEQEPTLLSDPTYSRVPFNGVIYADGNVRVRGFTDATSKDITIVSMGNIYVEGGINQLDTGTLHKGNVALLAKRNVVLNPTQFATQPAGWRSGMPVTLANTAVAPVTATATSVVDVTDTSNFRVGDVVTIGGKPTWWTVTNISIATGAGRITLSGTAAAIAAQGTCNTGEAIVALTDPAPDPAPDSSTRSESLSRGQAITRNLPVDGVVPPTTPYTLHLAFLQAGQNKTAFTLMNQSTVAANASTKAETNGVAGIQAIEKLLVADGSPATPYDLTTNTFGSLKLLFDGPGFPTPDPNLAWNFGVNPEFFPVPAYRVAAGLAPGVLPGASRPFLFTTSTDIHWRQNPTDLGVAAPAPTPDFLVGSPALAATDEDTNTVDERFYGTYDATTGLFSQAPLRGFTYLLPSAPTFDANNAVSLRHDLQAQPQLANYLYGTVKYDRADLTSVVAAPISYNIQAAIYAQDGSWFVMAMPAMTPNNASPTTFQTDQANRYRRLNYQITVKANIAENFAPTGLLDYDNEQTPDQSPLVIAVPPVLGLGAQAQWLDSSAYPVDNKGAKWQTINYLAPAPLPTSNTLYLPITPDIINQR